MDLQKVIKLTSSQYSILASGGTVGSYTGLNSSYLYLISDTTQYVPLAGTTSLYGSVIPATTGILNLGSDTKRFKSIYAYSLNARTLSGVSSAYISSASITRLWTPSISWPGDMAITANTTVLGGANSGTLSINAGSSIDIHAYISTYLMAKSGVNYIYGSEAVKIRAGNVDTPYSIYGYGPPYISVALSGGYYPSIYMSANLSGTGYIGMYSPNIQLMGDYIEVNPSSTHFTCHNVPVVTGYQHNIYASARFTEDGVTYEAKYYGTLILSTSASLTTPWQLLMALKSAGYYSSSTTNFLQGGMPWSYAAPFSGYYSQASSAQTVVFSACGLGAYYWSSSYRLLPHILSEGGFRAGYVINNYTNYTVIDRVRLLQY